MWSKALYIYFFIDIFVFNAWDFLGWKNTFTANYIPENTRYTMCMDCVFIYTFLSRTYIYTSAFSIRITFYCTCSKLFINHNFKCFEN